LIEGVELSVFCCVRSLDILERQMEAAVLNSGGAGGLLSTAHDPFGGRSGHLESSGASASQRHSTRTAAGVDPGVDDSDSAGGGPSSAAANGVVPTGAFSPRLGGDGQYTPGAAARQTAFYGTDTGPSPPSDYRPTSGKHSIIIMRFFHNYW